MAPYTALAAFFAACLVHVAAPALAAPPAATAFAPPLVFEPNHGQTDASVAFVARAPDWAAYLTTTGATLVTADHTEQRVLRIGVVGARADRALTGAEPLAGRSHYLRGRDAAKWKRDVPHYARVEQSDVVPGVDLVWRSRDRQLEYDLIVRSGTDPSALRVRIDGADALRVDSGGRVVATLAGVEWVQLPPVVHQEVGGERREIAAKARLASANEIAFEVADYDRSAALVIDPVIAWSTYVGGSGIDVFRDIAVDAAGAAYVVGLTRALDFPTTPGSLQPTKTDSEDVDAVVAKIAPDGRSFVYATYLGGAGMDEGHAIGVTPAGEAVVGGSTASPDFPLANAWQPFLRGGQNAFVTRLDASGSGLVYSTYLGSGNSDDAALGIDIDPSGTVHVAGRTWRGFPVTPNAAQPTSGSLYEGFLARIDAAGALVYATFLGGSFDDSATDVATDASGASYVIGKTASANFPIVDAVQPVFVSNPGSASDPFVAKLDAAGAFVYSTFLGGTATDEAASVATDGLGQTYVVGTTLSADFPLFNARQPTIAGLYDAFVTKLSPTGSFVYSTFLGGRGVEGFIAFIGFYRQGGIAADRVGSAYVFGSTESPDFPVANAFQPHPAGESDTFVAKLSANGQTLVHASFLGGANSETALRAALDAGGSLYVVGMTESNNFPVSPGAAQDLRPGGESDGFVTKIAIAPGSFECDVAIAEPAFQNGDVVSATTLRFRNRSLAPEPARVSLWLRLPGSSQVSLIDFGRDGSAYLPAGLDANLGPVNLFPVHTGLPRGSYALGCALTDPVSGAVHSADLAAFTLE